MLTYKDAIAEFRLMSDGGDPWGSVMVWWFAVADEIYWKHGGDNVPDSWLFSPSPMGSQNEPDQIESEVVAEMPLEDLLRFGKVLDRYAACVKRAGLDY